MSSPSQYANRGTASQIVPNGPPSPPDIPRALVFTTRQQFGIPVLFLIPIVAMIIAWSRGSVLGIDVEIIVRVVFTYVFLWACFRILGKRELTGMAPLEIVTLLLIPQLFSRALPGNNYSMANAVVGASTLLALVFVGSMLTYRSGGFARVTTPRPTVLVEQGKWVEAHMHQERMAPSDIFSAMHRSGLFRLEDVQWAVLQADGRIAIIPVEKHDQDTVHRQRAGATMPRGE